MTDTMDFFDLDEPYEAEPSYEELLAEKEQEIKDAWLLVQNEAECEFEDADVGKMQKLLADLALMQEARVNLLERIDMRDGV